MKKFKSSGLSCGKLLSRSRKNTAMQEIVNKNPLNDFERWEMRELIEYLNLADIYDTVNEY